MDGSHGASISMFGAALELKQVIQIKSPTSASVFVETVAAYSKGSLCGRGYVYFWLFLIRESSSLVN